MLHLCSTNGIIGLLPMILVGFATCGHNNSQEPDGLKRDHAEISKMLDAALLSDSPVASFRSVLKRVQSYPSVDSAWIDGSTFFVKYKHGGVLSWIVTPPKPNASTTNGEQQK